MSVRKKAKREWVDHGDGTGRMRVPKLARTRQQLEDHINSMSEIMSGIFVSDPNHPAPIARLHAQLLQAQKYLDDAKSKLREDLFHLGVITPAKFDWSALDKINNGH